MARGGAATRHKETRRHVRGHQLQHILPAGLPPVDDGGPLSSREIELIKKWIDDGARFGSGSAEGLGKIDKDLDARKVLGMPAREPNADAITHLEGIGATITPIAVTLPEYLSLEWISTYHKISSLICFILFINLFY